MGELRGPISFKRELDEKKKELKELQADIKRLERLIRWFKANPKKTILDYRK